MLTVIMIFLGIAVLLLFDGVLENYFPTTKEYSIQSPKIKEEKKVVLLTDLHACCVGGKKDKYLQMIQKQNPDILLLAGDMTVKNGKRTDCVIEFLKGIRLRRFIMRPVIMRFACRSMSLLSGRFKI